MNSVESTRYQLLAQVIQTGNDFETSEAILKLALESVWSIDLLDHYNIPFLIATHAAQNPDAQELLFGLQQAKSELFEEQKPEIFENFELVLKKTFEGRLAPQKTCLFLNMMTSSQDPDFARLGFQLLLDLEFADEHLIGAYGTALFNRARFSEAEELVQKLEKIERDLEEVDLEMEEDIDEEEENHANDEDLLNDSFLSDFSFGSEDSGIEEDSDEVLMDEEQARIEDENRFESAVAEIFLDLFKQVLWSRDDSEIQTFLNLIEILQLPIPHHLYRKHEISRLIIQNAEHIDDAMKLLEEIQRQE